MIFRPRLFRKPHAFLAALILAAGLGRTEPTAEDILAAARVNPLGRKITLNARLRSATVTAPFRIVVDGAIHYVFSSPDQELILELNDDSSVLSERLGGGGKKGPVRPARFDDSIRGTGVTYEDLSLRFLYWKFPKLLGEESLRGRKAWKIEVQSWGDSSQYGVARLWIDKESGALMRIEGYNREGKLIRRFEVVSAQPIDGQWMLKQMRVETLDPATKKTINRTYLEVLGKAQ